MNYLDFVSKYPAFEGVGDDNFAEVLEKILCLYPAYRDENSCEKKTLCYLLVAHYLIIEGRAVSVGLNQPSGLIASSSVGGVSVSMQNAPFKTSNDYFFMQTPYGAEYLAYLGQVGGMLYVN